MTGTQAFDLVKRFGTAKNVTDAAHYLAYGRTAAVRQLSGKILATIPAALYGLTA